MATLSITVQDALVPRIRAAIGRELGLESSPGVPRSATVAEVEAFVKRVVVEAVRNRERVIAAEAAAAAVTEVS
jgi:hypothetical protein